MAWSLPSASGNDPNLQNLLAFLPKRALRGSDEPEPEEDLEAEPEEEEYYAKQARIAKRLGLSNDNRTGRRTRNRSGPGPPSVRVPFNEKEFMRNRKPENRPLFTPKPARIFSKYVFGGDPPPPPREDTPNLMDASGDGSESGQPGLVPQPVFQFPYQDIRHKGKVPKDGNVKLESEQIGQANQVMDCSGASSSNNCLKPPDKQDKEDKAVAKLDDRPLERPIPWYSHLTDVKEIKEVWEPLEFTYANKVKVKLASLVVCFECKESCGFPGFSCVNGHPICQMCQRKCSVLENEQQRQNYCEKSTPFTCPGCAVVDVRREMSGVNQMLEQLKFTCYCGQVVRGTQAGDHLKCDALEHRPQKVLVCETFGADICEFCNQQVIYRKYVDHLFREHFERRFLPLSNEDLIKMPKAEPLFQREFALPLQGQEALGVRSSGASRIVAAPDFGKFTLYQMPVEKELTWCLSFEMNPTAKTELSTSQFQAKLKFEAVVENRLYRKTCQALVYPLCKGMDENIFLELVRLSLPDAWLPRFKFASTCATTLNIQIYRSNKKYVRRCGRIFQVEL